MVPQRLYAGPVTGKLRWSGEYDIAKAITQTPWGLQQKASQTMIWPKPKSADVIKIITIQLTCISVFQIFIEPKKN